MTTFNKLTPASAALLVKMINEAEYESPEEGGMSDALMAFTSAERGNLSDLKKKGIVTTLNDEETPGYIWVIFEEPARPIYQALKG
jgi:hypothetical protein